MNYGRYCGPGNSGPGTPIDSLDWACKAHDECFKWTSTNKKCNCDLVVVVRKILPRLKGAAKNYAYKVLAVFETNHGRGKC